MEWAVKLVIVGTLALTAYEISFTATFRPLTSQPTTTTATTTASNSKSTTESSVVDADVSSASTTEDTDESTTEDTDEDTPQPTTVSTTTTKFTRRKFPEEFRFGAATSAYQVEGAWNEDGKTPNVWDLIFHDSYSRTLPVVDLSNGDIAADTYRHYIRDVEMMRELGLAAYGISLSWSRILPTCRMDNVNYEAIGFYNDYINEMLKFNITPIVTLFHMDLPKCIMREGGFVREAVVDRFDQYARTAFMIFGDRVKHWITFGEPKKFCQENYGLTPYPANYSPYPPIENEYHCARYLLLAHATAYKAYDRDFKLIQNGVCGISIVVNWFHTNKTEEQQAAELYRQTQWMLYTEPIFSAHGGFPDKLVKSLNPNRIEQFTNKEKLFIKGTYDFFGLAHYAGYSMSFSRFRKWNMTSLYDNLAEKVQERGGNPLSNPLDYAGIPSALYLTLTDLSKRYGGPEFLITGVGWHSRETDRYGGMEDDERIMFLRSMLDDCYDALLAGIRITGFNYWSLMDTFEWQNGYSTRTGLYSLNLTDPMRERTPRKSAFAYAHAIKTRSVDYGYDPPYPPPHGLFYLKL